MTFQSLLFTKELKGSPRYELNSNFYNWGIIADIIEHKSINKQGYQYQYKIGSSVYHELILLQYEIENNFVFLDNLNRNLKAIYLLNCR